MQTSKKIFRLIIPKFPYFNVYSNIPMSPYGGVMIATIVNNLPGWKAEIIDENNTSLPDLGKTLEPGQEPSVIGIYVGLTSICLRAYDLAQFYTEQGIPVIAGGAHVASLPDEALKNGITVVVHGEGEKTIVEVIERLLNKPFKLDDIEGISFTREGEVITTPKRQPIENLDELPSPNFSLIRNLAKPMKYLSISKTRGCRFKCEFCCVHSMLGPIHSRSAEKVMEDIKANVTSVTREIFFTDDNFAENREETLKLCKLLADYRKTNKKFDVSVQVRAEIAKDDEMLEAMWSAGVKALCIGFESPCPSDLKNMKKGLRPDKMLSYARRLTSLGFYVHGMFIFGYPGEDGSIIDQSSSLKSLQTSFKHFVRRAKLDTVQVLKAVPLPGTKLAKRLEAMGKILPKNIVNWDKYDGNWVCFDPGPNCTPGELQKAGTSLMRWFYGKRSIVRQSIRSAWSFICPLWLKRTAFKTSVWKQKYNIKQIILAWWSRIKHETRNLYWRVGGHILVKRWLKAFHKERFEEALHKITYFRKK